MECKMQTAFKVKPFYKSSKSGSSGLAVFIAAQIIKKNENFYWELKAHGHYIEVALKTSSTV